MKKESRKKSNKSKTSMVDSAVKVNDAGLVTDVELECGPGRLRLTRYDYILAPLFALAAGWWSFPYIGTATHWDDLLYMALSSYTRAEGYILNRYWHIYMQKFFFWIAGDALVGGRVFWCFLYFGTAVLVYWCAKILAGRKQYVVGVIAVMLYIMHRIFIRSAGCTFADLTVMFMMMLGVFVYLAFLEEDGKYRHLIIILLGLIFFMALKSKETGVCMGVLFFGVSQDKTGSIRIRRFIRDIGWAFVGGVVGCIIIMMFDLIFLGDFWFSIRPSSFEAVLSWNFRPPPSSRGRSAMSWYTHLSVTTLLTPFILYIVVGCKSVGRRFLPREKVVWLIPIVILFFLIYIRNHWFVMSRYLVPAIPGFAIWAGQFFYFKLGGKLSIFKRRLIVPRWSIALILTIIAFVIVHMFMLKVPSIAEYYRLKGSGAFYNLAIITFSTTVLLMIAGISKKRGLIVLFLSALSLFSLIYFPLTNGFDTLVKRTWTKTSFMRFEPCRVFSKEFELDKNIKILVSKDIYQRYEVMGRDEQAHCRIFNLFFNGRLDYEQFIDGDMKDILKGNYKYGLITEHDWQAISKSGYADILKKNYEIIDSEAFRIILLKKL